MATFYNQLVPAAGTYVTDPLILSRKDKSYCTIQSALTYGAGGTSIDVFLQTTVDDGITWRDVANHAFLITPANKLSAINKYIAATAAQAVSDGALADDTIVNGVMGLKWRLKIIVVGTYTTSTLRVDVDFHDE